jgi:hypothetical protein
MWEKGEVVVKAKRNIVIGGAVLCTVLVISCSDDSPDPEPSKGGSAGVAGAAGSKAQAGSGGTTTAGSSSGGGGSGGQQQGGEGGQPLAGSPSGGAPIGGEGGGGGDAGSGGEDSKEPPIDCSQVPSKPIKVEELKGPRAYHDIAFDTLGNLIGNHNEDLLKTALDGKPKMMLAGVGMLQGFDLAVNGDLYAVGSPFDDNTSLLRITPEGGQESVIDIDYGAYGVRIGPDGFIYVAASDSLLRIDPVTKKTTLVPSNVEGWAPRVMDYSPDKKKLYVGTLGEGTVYAYDLDETGKPKGYPKEFAKHVGDGYHDGLGVDACGNVYVADFLTSGLYRITPEGEVTVYQDWTDTFGESSSYGHGMEWGSGVGGYEKTSLYMPQPYDDNTVVRLDLGVPARPR